MQDEIFIRCRKAAELKYRPVAHTARMLPSEQLAFTVFLILEIGRHWNDIEHGLADIDNLISQGVDINRAFEAAANIGFVETTEDDPK